jgi:Spy/CpxP family protein refolding chaperone
MKSTRLRFLIAALVVVLGTALANAQTSADAPPMRGHGPEFGMGGHMGFFARELNLTDDQKAQMKTIMDNEHPTMKPLMQQEHQIDRQLRTYVEDAYDAAKVRTLATQKAKLEVEITVQQTRIHNEMYQLLTSDQQAKVKELEANREAQMQQHMQDEPPPPPSE